MYFAAAILEKAIDVAYISLYVLGVVETGLFVDMAECAIFGKEDGTVTKR